MKNKNKSCPSLISEFLQSTFLLISLVFMSTYATWELGISDFYALINFIPLLFFKILGLLQVIIWIPIFILGAYSLGKRGMIGKPEKLVTNGIYKYVRHPMYSAVSIIILGIGLFINDTGIIFSGLLWIFISLILCKTEEKGLVKEFGQKYLEYKAKTPLFLPSLGGIIRDLFKKN